MSAVAIGAASLFGLFVLLVLRVPIGLPMLIIGIAGAGGLSGDWAGVWVSLSGNVYFTFASYTLAILPLLILMAQFSTLNRTAEALYRAASSFFGHWRGGVVLSGVLATLGLSSICGSNSSTSSSLQPVLKFDLERREYPNNLKYLSLTSTVAVGVFMPPSILLIIYAMLTDQEIVKLFLAALIPLLLAAFGYFAVFSFYARAMPKPDASNLHASWSEKAQALYDVWPVLLVFVLVVGGIYFQWYRPTEAAAVGAAGTALIAVSNGGLTWDSFKKCLLDTAFLSARLYLLVLGAAFFNTFLISTQLPQEFSAFVLLHDYNPWLVLILMLLTYFLFACRSDSLALIILTVPLFYPIVSNLDFGLSAHETAIWMGILVLTVIEMGLLVLSYSALYARDKSVGNPPSTGSALVAQKSLLLMITLRIGVLLIWPGIALYLTRMI